MTDIVEASPSRPSSPSPSASPSVAIAFRRPKSDDRAVSSPSTVPGLSSRSTSAASDASSFISRRGYMKPHGTSFSTSARNRDSVMSLGSISHVQYYFSKTGQLDGKGGQLARPDSHGQNEATTNAWPTDVQHQSVSYEDVFGQDTDQEDTDIRTTFDMSECSGMLPPTASTYKARPIPVHILPDTSDLRKDLRKALSAAQAALENMTPPDGDVWWREKGSSEHQSGGAIVELLASAIQAAKNYYIEHHNISRLYAIRSERKIRNDLYRALEHLQGLENRGTVGKLNEVERTELLGWIDGLNTVIDDEEGYESREKTLRKDYSWLYGDWNDRERERERAFLQSFTADTLPEWTPPNNNSSRPCRFLKMMQDGIMLLQLHNEMIDRSERRFGAVSKFHTDVSKPYRSAENLRYWLKAAELRWEVHLELDVLELVYERSDQVWLDFDQALLRWCASVRGEITSAWIESPLVATTV